MEAGSRIDKRKAVGKRLVWSPQPILCSNQFHVVQAQRDNVGKGAQQREKEKTKKEGKEYGKKKKYFLTPRLCPNKGVLGLA